MTTAAGLTHEHLLVRSDEEHVALVAAAVERSVGAGEHVLVCLPAEQWTRVAEGLGSVADGVRFVPGGDRYARPATAMVMLGNFVEEAAALGRRACSIGSIPFAGTAADSPWFRYEAAVNAVFATAPLHAVCVTDARTTPPEVVHALGLLHDHPGHDAAETAEARRRFLRRLPPAGEVPARPADVEARTPRDARAAIRAELRPSLDPVVAGDLELVVTELLGNSASHAGSGVARIWREAEAVVVAVTDDGPGITTWGPASGADRPRRRVAAASGSCSSSRARSTSSSTTPATRSSPPTPSADHVAGGCSRPPTSCRSGGTRASTRTCSGRGSEGWTERSLHP